MWSYTQNPFASLSKRSYKQFLIFSRDHRDKLKQRQFDPNIQPLYLRIETAFTQFEQDLINLGVQINNYRLHTRKFEDLILELSNKKIRNWDVQIQIQYDIDTPEYSQLFPNRRTPFQGGAYELRINALQILATTLQSYPSLAATMAEVQDFLNKINDARTAQQGQETNEQILRSRLEQDTAVLAKELHFVFASLLVVHYEEPNKIEDYYELKYLRTSIQSSSITTQEHTVFANNRVTLYSGQLLDDDYLYFKNTGTVPLFIFTSSTQTAAVPLDATVLQPNDTLDGVYANTLSDGTGANWLILVNEESNNGKCEVGKE